MAPSGGGKAGSDDLARRLETLRRHGHLDPIPTFETRVDYPPSAPHPTGIPYVCVAPQVYDLLQYRRLLRTELPLPSETAPACCRDPESICTEFRRVAQDGDEAAFVAFFGALSADVMILDMTETGKDGRAMYTETVDLGPDFIADWDNEKKRFMPVSAKNSHLHAIAPGHSLVVVDKDNLAHFECKGGKFTGAAMARVRRSTPSDDKAHKAAGVMLEAVPELRSVGGIKDYEICAAPVGDLDGDRFTRLANFYETVAVLNVAGNEKGPNSHTVGPTRIDMANASIVQPPPLWRIEDPNILMRLHPNLVRAKAIYAQLQDRHRIMTALRGCISLAIVRLLLPPRVFQILEDRAHLHGGLRSGIAENFATQHPPAEPRAPPVSDACSRASATPDLPEPPADLAASNSLPLFAESDDPPRYDTPPRRADDARIIGIAQGLGDFFGRLHLDDRDDYALFSTLIPEGLLPRGSTLGAFLLAEYGAVFDLLSYDLDSDEDDWTIAAISGDSLHVGSDVQLAPNTASDGVCKEDDPFAVPESDAIFRVVSVNYPTYAGTAAPPTIPITAGAALTDPSIYRANVPVVVMTHDGLGSAIWGDSSCGRVVIARVAARESLWRHIQSWLDMHHDIARGAPKQVSLEQFFGFSLALREAIWAAAKAVEGEWQISWESEWTREARRLGVPPDVIEAFAGLPNPFGAHDSRTETNWRARLRAIEHLAIRAGTGRNKIRGWTDTSAAFKERSGNRLDLRTRKYHHDPSLPRLPAAPPSLYFPLLTTPLAPSHLAAAGIAVRTVTLDDFSPALMQRHVASREIDGAAWKAEEALVAKYTSAHKTGIAVAEKRWNAFHSAVSAAPAEPTVPTLPKHPPAALPPPAETAPAAEALARSPLPQVVHARPSRISWRWRDTVGRPIDANGNIYLDLVTEQRCHGVALQDPLSTTATSSSSAATAPVFLATDTQPTSATTGERPKRNAAQAGLDAAAGTETVDRAGKASRGRTGTASGGRSTVSEAAKSTLIPAVLSSKLLAGFTGSGKDEEIPPQELIAERFGPVLDESVVSVAQWPLHLDDPARLQSTREMLSSASDIMRGALPTGATACSVRSLTKGLAALGRLKESSSTVDALIKTMWYTVLYSLAEHIELALWPAAVDGANRIQRLDMVRTGAQTLSPRESAVRQYVYLATESASFPSASGDQEWSIERSGRPAVRRKSETAPRRGASRQVRDIEETYALAYALLDLAILDLFSLPSLDTRDRRVETTTVSIPHILTATGPVPRVTTRFLQHVHRTLALISTFVSSTGSTAILLLPAVHSAIEQPEHYCRPTQRNPSTASGFMAMGQDWAEALPGLMTPSRCLRLNSALDQLGSHLGDLGLGADAIEIAASHPSYYPCKSQAVIDYEDALNGNASSNESVTESDNDDDDDRDPTYVPVEHLRHLEFLSRLAARRAAAGRDLLRFDLKALDDSIEAAQKKISTTEQEIERLARDRKLFAMPERNLTWLSVIFCEMLLLGFELHPDHFPVNPFDSPSLVRLHDALKATSDGQELQGAILRLARTNGLDWALWLKQGHEVEMFAPPELAPAALGERLAPDERRRRAFTVFCVRGIIVGSTPAVYTAVPATGWLGRSDFLAWLARPDVSAMRVRNSGPNRLWTNGTPYGSWTDLDEFHVWNYDIYVEEFIRRLDDLAAEAETERPSYSAVVSLLRRWEVPKTLIAERGQTYDQRRADRARDSRKGAARTHESKENKEKKASKVKSTEPALPILGGALSSLHVATDLVRYGLVEPPSDEEMGLLLDGMKDLGASRGLAELGFIRKRALKTFLPDADGTERPIVLPRVTTREAFMRFGRLFRRSLAPDIIELFEAADIIFTASLLENLCCKFSRGPWSRLRLETRFQRVLDSLPSIFTTSDREWELRGDEARLEQLDKTIAAKQELLAGLRSTLRQTINQVEELEQGAAASAS